MIIWIDKKILGWFQKLTIKTNQSYDCSNFDLEKITLVLLCILSCAGIFLSIQENTVSQSCVPIATAVVTLICLVMLACSRYRHIVRNEDMFRLTDKVTEYKNHFSTSCIRFCSFLFLVLLSMYTLVISPTLANMAYGMAVALLAIMVYLHSCKPQV